MLAKSNINYEDIRCKLSFDLTIEIVSGTEFTGNIQIELPTGNIITNGISNYKEVNFNDIIFKRN